VTHTSLGSTVSSPQVDAFTVRTLTSYRIPEEPSISKVPFSDRAPRTNSLHFTKFSALDTFTLESYKALVYLQSKPSLYY